MRFLKDDSHSWDKLTMHASHIKKKDFNLTLNSFFEISKYAIFKRKIFRSVFNENTDQFCDQKRIQICI